MKDLFFWMSGLSLLMALVWAFRIRKTPTRAKIMGVAFVLMALLSWGFGVGWPVAVLGLVGASLFVALAADMAVRSADKAKESP